MTKIFLNGSLPRTWEASQTDDRLMKIIIFEWLRSIGQMTEENYNIILITILEQAPLQLYQNERLGHFLI